MQMCIRDRDIPSWMELLRLVVDGYPVLDETDYLHKLKIFIRNRQALVLKDGDLLIGALAFGVLPCSIEFMGIHPVSYTHLRSEKP